MTEGAMLQDDDVKVEHVPVERLRTRMQTLFSSGFTMLTDVAGVDFPERPLRFDVVYSLMKLPLKPASVAEIGRPERIRVITQVGEEKAVVPTVCDIWPSANWAEREIYDLFGVSFSGHPDMRRIQMPDDWVGHPLRRDYPLRGLENEATPRPSFANKSNVPSGTPVAGRVAAAIAARKAAKEGSN